MPRFYAEPDFTHGAGSKTAVLLVNLGTPDEPTTAAVRRYLKQFLSDPRVVEIPKPVWWLILNGIILNVRPRKSAAKYATVWTSEGSPLKFHTAKQAKLLRGWLSQHGGREVEVAYAMRYGNPSIASQLDALKAAGAERILILPLYPQYAASTTASTTDAVSAWLSKTRHTPELRFVKHFHDDAFYIAALKQSVLDTWQREYQSRRPDVLVMSFHGLPRYTLDKGDPYHCECLKTGRLLAEALGLEKHQYRVTFQSRFGKAEWLKPYTSATLDELGRAKTARVDVVCPGFPADCLETLEEIALEAKETFQHAGGGNFTYLPCLNERDDWIAALGSLALRHLQGWPLGKEPDAAHAKTSAALAQAAGAPR